MEEVEHIIRILEESKEAIRTHNSLKLKHLSDQTIHSASIYQHTDYIIIATLIYALSKLMEKENEIPKDKLLKFIKKCENNFNLGIDALKKSKQEAFLRYLEQTRKDLENVSIKMKPIIIDLLKKASINKASKLHEHGISLGQTAKLLGVNPWELSDYIGQKDNKNIKYNRTINAKSRIKTAMEFFS